MGRYFCNRAAGARTCLLESGDWELQILETPLWIPEETSPLSVFTAVLLCPANDEKIHATDHLQHEFQDTTWTAERLPSGEGRIDHLVRSLPARPWPIPLLVYVGRATPEQVAEIRRALQLLENEPATSCVIVCCDHADVRESLDCASGFVCHGLRTTSREALHIAAMLHGALAAPHTITCIDLEDIKQALGSASKPALYGEGIRIHGTGQIEMLSHGEDPWIHATAAFALLYLSPDAQTGARRELIAMLRERIKVDGQIFWAQSVDFHRSVLMQGAMDRIRFFLRSD